MGIITGTRAQRAKKFQELLKFPYWELVSLLHEAGYHKEVAKVFRDAVERGKCATPEEGE